MAAIAYLNDPRAVTSVEGRTGDVDITPEDVGVQEAVEEALGTTVADAITEHAGDTDPHGDRGFATSAVATHAAAADPHADRAFATAGIATHAGAADPHADRAFTTAAIASHAVASDPHGDRAYTDGVAATKANTSHTHAAADTTSGTFDIARIPTGTSGTTVSLGNHAHAVATGGTGLTSVTANSYVKGNGTSALVERTYAQVRTDLGFDAAWTAPESFATNMTNAGSPWYDVGAWISPDGEHHWRGRVLAGANYTANATIFTLAAGVRPTRDVEFQVRSIGVGAAAGFLKITASTGAVSFSASITVGAGSGWPLDGVQFWGGAN